jgi:hypothetical protein
MKISKYLPLVIVFCLFFVSINPIAGVSRPAYALSATDQFIVENDYELLTEWDQTVGTIEEYFSVWVKPSDCYPIDVGTPPCTGAFGASYNADSDTDLYDEAYYEAMRNVLLYPGFEEITEDVPGAGIALVYTPFPGVYSAIAFFGVKTGIFVVVAEYQITVTPSTEDLPPIETNAYYDKDGMKTIMVEIGEKIDKNVRLPGFETVIAIGAIVSLAVMVNVIKRKKI